MREDKRQSHLQRRQQGEPSDQSRFHDRNLVPLQSISFACSAVHASGQSARLPLLSHNQFCLLPRLLPLLLSPLLLRLCAVVTLPLGSRFVS